MIVHRTEMRDTLARLLSKLTGAPLTETGEEPGVQEDPDAARDDNAQDATTIDE